MEEPGLKKVRSRQLTLQQKGEILDLLDSGVVPQKSIAIYYRTDPGNITKIKMKRDSIRSALAMHPAEDRKSLFRHSRFGPVNALTLEFYNSMRSKGLPINGPILQSQAKFFAQSLGFPDFAASTGWLNSFRKRHNISSARCREPTATQIAETDQITGSLLAFTKNSGEPEADGTAIMDVVANEDRDQTPEPVDMDMDQVLETDESGMGEPRIRTLEEAIKTLDALKRFFYRNHPQSKAVPLLIQIETSLQTEFSESKHGTGIEHQAGNCLP